MNPRWKFGVLVLAVAGVFPFALASETLRVLQFGSESADRVIAAAVGPGGDTWVVGWTSGAFPGHIGAGNDDVFAARVSATGEMLWTRQFGFAQSDSGTAVAI